jgi:hypothetical protein
MCGLGLTPALANDFISAGNDSTDNIIVNVDSDGSGNGIWAVIVGEDYRYSGLPNPDGFAANFDFEVRSNSVVVNEVLDVNAGIAGENFTVQDNTGNTAIGGTLQVNGATTINNTATISGATTINNTATISGATTINNTATISGATTINNTLNVNNDFVFDSNGNVVGGSTIAGSDSSLALSSQNVTINGNRTVAVPSMATGVMITGSAQGNTAYDPTTSTQPPNWADVAIYSANYGGTDPTLGAAVLVTDYGIQLINPTPSLGQTIYNSQGANSGNGTVGNQIGINSGNGSVSNTFGSATNTSGPNSSVVNNFGANDGQGTVENRIGGGMSATSNHIGNGNANSAFNATAGASSLQLSNSSASMRGGVNGNALTITDSGARFGSSSGQPISVTGVDDGVGEFDAVNVGQFASAIAASSALAGIPSLRPGHTHSIGFGVGSFMGYDALAFGATALSGDNFSMKFSGAVDDRGGAPIVSAGAGWSW